MRQRLMVVVAHPDDESFGCGSTLLHAAAAGVTTAVVCATRGEAGDPAPGSHVGHAELARVRERELHEAANILGVSSVRLLDFTDSGMAGDADASTLVGAPFGAVRDAVRGQVEDFRPHVVITLDAADGHRDHARIRDATVAAVEGTQVQRVYLQCLSQELMQRWLEHARIATPDSAYLTASGTPDPLVTTLLDSADLLPLREKAIAAHGSQVSPYAGLPPDLYRNFLTVERLQRVVPPWSGGERETGLF